MSKKIDSIAEWLDSLEQHNPADDDTPANAEKWEVNELVKIARQYRAFLEQPED